MSSNSEANDSHSGTLFVVSAPSGAGKTSLVARLLENDDRLVLSISHTTRDQRPGEVDGEHYHYIDEAGFRHMLEADAFLEHAAVYDHHYGTALDNVAAPLRAGRDVVLEIDWQGARQVRRRLPDCTGIFVLPPSLAALEARLRARGQDADDVISRRMQKAVAEMSHYDEFDYLVINDDFDIALDDLRAIVRACRLERAKQAQARKHLLAGLLADR